jgi:hypothetical protein
MSYVDLNTIHNPATGTVAPAAWGDQIRDNFEFLIDPPACSVYNSTSQSLVDNTTTTMTADSENFDNNAMHSTVSNTGRITAQTAGRYQFIGSLTFASNATGLRQIVFRIDGTTIITPTLQVAAVSTGGTAVTFVADIVLAASQYVETQGRQTSGGNLATTLTEFSATWITR